MIELENLTVKNFMSVGQQTQSINFTSDSLTLVLGSNLDLGGEDTGSRNGTGKCVCINTLVKVRNTLTGEITEITMGELYNNHRKMHQLSDTINRKFIDCVDLQNLEIETDSGWHPVSKIMKTIPYQVWNIQTESNKTLECADDHILFDENLNEIFVKDIKPFSYIQTEDGPELVTAVSISDRKENMFDITVDSDNHRYYTNGILSHNTTIINSLSYLIYGEALSRIKKENLINKTNGKGMLVTGAFRVNGVRHRIERGRKPTFLKLYIDDKEHIGKDAEESQGDSRETQKFIENLIGMSHTMFKHIVALNTYTEPFLSLKAADQREVIEELIGSTMLSTKAESLKLLIKENKDTIAAEQIKIDSIKHANEGIQRSINSLIAKKDAWNNKQKKDLEEFATAISELESLDIATELESHKLLKLWRENNTQLQNLKKQKATLDSSLTQADRNVKKYTIELEKLADNKCPQCDQELHNDTHDGLIIATEKNLSDSVDYYNTVNNNIDALIKQIASIGDIGICPTTFYTTESDAFDHRNQLSNLETALINCNNETNPYTDQIDELENTALQNISWDKINELTKLKEHQDFLLKLLTNKDSFIRKKIIDQNLAHLNHRLSYYLEKLKLPHLVKFKNDLEVEITDFGKDLDFDNLSRGERNRLILSMSFAFRDVWESLYQSVNLLFVDELMDSGLDLAGVEAGLLLLKQMAREGGKNIYLISHKDELISRVNSILRVVKENSYTSYSNSTEPVGLI